MKMKISDYTDSVPNSLSLPRTSFELERLLNDPSSDIDDFSDIICLDAPLTSKLLKLANSPIFNLRGQVSTVSKAIQVIGVTRVYEMTLSTLASSAVNQLDSDDINIEDFWQRSVFCALCAKYIAEAIGIKDFERLFVSGLMINLGELLVYISNPSVALLCNESTKSGLLPWDAQKKIMGFTYSDITHSLLQSWDLPSQLTMPIKYFNDAPNLDINQDVKVLYLASRITVSEFNLGKFPFSEIFDENVFYQIGLCADDIQEISTLAKKHTADIVAILSGA
jgi:HD-like signal output (HDOD) protein